MALRPNAWHLPDRVPMVGWLDTFPEMSSVRSAINADPIMGVRMDTAVGTEFSLQDRRLNWLLVEHLLEPMVVTVHAYRFDEAVFDAQYDRLEAGLVADEVRLVEFLPLNGFISSFEEVELSDGLVLRPMTDWQMSAASRLVRALRIVCGGSAVTTRSIRAQHDDDFPPTIGESAARPAIVTADLHRPTKLMSSEDVDAIREIHRLLDTPTVRDDRALQTALRRLVLAGSRSLPSDRLIDLIICAEALFLKREDFSGGNKREAIAERAEKLLVDDPALSAPLGAVKRFMEYAYIRRNAEVHGEDPPAETLTLLDGTMTDKLDAVVDDLERVMRRATYRLLRSDELGQLA